MRRGRCRLGLLLGGGGNGDLGHGAGANVSTPVQVSGIDDAIRLSAASDSAGHTCVGRGSGDVYCFGYNGNGMLGDETTTQRLSPVRAHLDEAATLYGDSRLRGAVVGVSGGRYGTLAVQGGYLAFLATGVGEYSWRLPSGYGLFLGETGEGHWETNHHLLNTGAESIEVGGAYTFHVQDETARPLARMFTSLSDIHVAPGSEGTVEGTFTAPFELDIVLLASHMHEHGKRFEMFFFDGATTAAVPFYVSEDWDSPRAVLADPPLRLRRGQGITYRCTYRNFENRELVYGTTKGFEMCSLWNYYAYAHGHGFDGLRPPELGGENATAGSQAAMTLGGTRPGATIESLTWRQHQDNRTQADRVCPAGLAATDAGGEAATGAACAILTDPCFLCIGVSCGAEYTTCQSDSTCASAMNLATACLCETQATGAPSDACLTSFEASGAPATAFGSCLGTRCSACGV